MLVAAVAGRDAVLLTVRGLPRQDVEVVMERIAGSLEIAVPGATIAPTAERASAAS